MTDLDFEHNGTEERMTAERTEDGWRIRLPNRAAYEISACATERSVTTLISAAVDRDGVRGPDRRVSMPYARVGQGVALSWKGRVYHFQPVVRGRASAPRAGKSGRATAPAGGVVAEVLVVEGQEVQAYEQIAIIEAMKVMTPVEAPWAGAVGKLFVVRGQRIEQGAEVAQIEPPAAGKPDERVAS